MCESTAFLFHGNREGCPFQPKISNEEWSVFKELLFISSVNVLLILLVGNSPLIYALMQEGSTTHKTGGHALRFITTERVHVLRMFGGLTQTGQPWAPVRRSYKR